MEKNFISIKEPGSLASIKKDLAGFLKAFLPVEEERLISLLERPRRAGHGQLSLPLFSLFKEKRAKEAGKVSNPVSASGPAPASESSSLKPDRPEGTSPVSASGSASAPDWAKALARDISAHKAPFLKSCEALSAFVNFRFKETYLQRHVELFASQKTLGLYPDRARRQHWVLDFASPNVAKHINIGHLRAASLGQSLSNLLRAFGFKLTALNHLGDWGGQFGKLLWAYKKWGTKADFKTQPFDSMAKLYVRFYKEAEGDKKSLDEARELFHKLEKGDPELKALWSHFVRLSLEEYDKYWKAFNIRHDLVQGESFYVDLLSGLKKRLNKKGLLEKSDGAEVVFLEKDSPPCLIVKSDGASTYAGRDLASLIYRFEELKADKNIYIAGSDQKLHFRQVFQTAGKIQPEWEKSSLYLSFGMYRFKGEGKMSSRKGQAVYLKDILQQAVQRVKKIIEERNPGLKNKEKVCLQVAVGALVFNDLMNDRLKDVDFDWKRILDFEGGTGPFIQYSLVRAKSLLAKAARQVSSAFSDPAAVDSASATDPAAIDPADPATPATDPAAADPAPSAVTDPADPAISAPAAKKPVQFLKSLEGDSEISLAWLLLCFESALFHSLKNFKPHILARYLLDLAMEFNRFYTKERVLGSPREADRLQLVMITKRALSRGMDLLNIPKPEAM